MYTTVTYIDIQTIESLKTCDCDTDLIVNMSKDDTIEINGTIKKVVEVVQVAGNPLMYKIYVL